MKKQTYRFLRRHGIHGAGDEVELTEEQAQQIDNAAPGALERTVPETPSTQRDQAKAAPKKDDA